MLGGLEVSRDKILLTGNHVKPMRAFGRNEALLLIITKPELISGTLRKVSWSKSEDTGWGTKRKEPVESSRITTIGGEETVA